MLGHRFTPSWAPVAAGLLCLLLAAGPALSQDFSNEPAGGSGDQRSLLEFIRAGGAIGYVILLLSVAGTALVVDAFLRIQEDKLVPQGLVDECVSMAGKRRFADMAGLCRTQDSSFARIVRDALSQGQLGVSAVREAMQSAGSKELTRLHQRVGYIGFIASVAPMLGLLGTVVGMIQSFDVLGQSKGAARPDELAVGVSAALVTTCMGLILAVPLLFFSSFFHNRVTRIGQTAAETCDRLMRVMTLAVESRPAGRAGEPAGAREGQSAGDTAP